MTATSNHNAIIIKNNVNNVSNILKNVPLPRSRSTLLNQLLTSSPTTIPTTATNRRSSNTGSASGNTSSNTIGHYELKKTIGKGNFSIVKLAQHKVTNQEVAVKIIRLYALSEDNITKVNREIEILKKLVTEHCPNGELYDLLIKKGRLSERQSCRYFLQILSAVEYLHNHNIVHRDLKAENLLLTDNFNTVKIADFGFANYFQDGHLLSTWCGSPPYAAPELFLGMEYIGPAVDIWSLGVILFVLITGSLPFDGPTLLHLKHRVIGGRFHVPFFMSMESEELIRKMLHLRPERRFNINQIRAHKWTRKYIDLERAEQQTSVTSTNGTYDKPIGSASSYSFAPPLETTTSALVTNAAKLNIKDPEKGKSSSNNRGQSLDLEDDKNKTKQVVGSAQRDELLLCRIGSNGADSKAINQAGDLNPSNVSNFVDTAMAYAVSNMSIDSNNSSISHSIDGAMTLSNQSAIQSVGSSRMDTAPKDDSGRLNFKPLCKGSSIDDQIIEFMVEKLKVADTKIRQSIAYEKFDDLHGMYRLLKDRPELIIGTKFNHPSLPLISPSKDDKARKPSITTGFFNLSAAKMVNGIAEPATTSTLSSATTATTTITPNSYAAHQNGFDLSLRPRGSFQLEDLDHQNDALNLVKKNNAADPNRLYMGNDRQRRSEDHSWMVPPQLFLTPPAENRTQMNYSIQKNDEPQSNGSSSTNQDAELSAAILSGVRQMVARYSFDSTVQHQAFNTNNCSDNMTNLTNYSPQRNWDSAVLDSHGVSISPTTQAIVGDSSMSASYSDNHNNSTDYNGNSFQMVQNLAKITTNLPEIGAQSGGSSMVNHNLLLAQLNSATYTAAMTQSGVLTQYEPTEQRLQANIPMKFTPNNLVNQNYNVMNNLKLPGNMPNLSLLDPDNLANLERRASDGQASYSSLTIKNNLRSSNSDVGKDAGAIGNEANSSFNQNAPGDHHDDHHYQQQQQQQGDNLMRNQNPLKRPRLIYSMFSNIDNNPEY